VEELLSLPGIGDYTSGAVASIAFGVKAPAVDGNVLRVITRLAAYDGDIAKTAVKAEIRQAVLAAMPEARPGDFNQALMELGATVCLPSGAPQCADCPLADLCEAHRSGTTARYPVKAPKKPQRAEEKTVFLITFEGRVALRKRPDSGLLKSLW
jgi:A/G-specific adenine glycosylase